MLRPVFMLMFSLFTAMVPLAAQAPEGWLVRIDRSENASDPDDVPDLKVAAIGKGFRATGGPAGTFWNPANRVTGNYTARATFNLMKPSGHVNYYGLVFGGSDLEGAAQKYVYFMVAQNGTYIIRSRAGEQVQDVRERVQHAAARQPGGDGRSTNTLEVRVAGNTISYVINGSVVHTTPKSGATATTDGLVGIRINHVLDVQVENFEVVRQ